MINNTIKRYSLSKQVSDELEQMIARGEYVVGDKIPTETELIEMFQVSRNTIREAIKALTWAGILEIKQGDGTYVISSNRFAAALNQRYEEISIEDIKEARKCIEVTIADLAARRYLDSDVEEMKRSFEKRQSCLEDEKENTRADIEFHMAIAKACHNVILLDLYQSISDYLMAHITERKHELSFSAKEVDILHEKLYKAILERNEKEAALAAHNIVNI